MKRLLKPKLIFSLVTVGLLTSALAFSLLFAFPGRSHAASNDSLEGSWLVTSTCYCPPPPITFQALYTYDAGGGVVETDQTGFNPAGLSSPAHGAWISLREDHFASTVINFNFDGKGNPIGTVKSVETDTLSQDGNAYSGSVKIYIFDANGKLLFTATAKNHATRIQVQGT